MWTTMIGRGRTLTVRVQRETLGDRVKERVRYLGCQFFWPDGRPIGTGLQKLCHRGIRLLVGRGGLQQASVLVQLSCLPIEGKDAPIPQIPPGVRSARFYLLRQRRQGILHFFNGLATDVVFDEDRDERTVLEWIGLTRSLADGSQRWFDLVVRPIDMAPIT